LGVGHGGPGIEGDEDVRGACHEDFEAGGLELGPEAEGDIEGEVFLLEMIAGDAAIHAAVAGIEHHGVECAGGIDETAGAPGEEEKGASKEEAERELMIAD
jgi:hypothetical protein